MSWPSSTRTFYGEDPDDPIEDSSSSDIEIMSWPSSTRTFYGEDPDDPIEDSSSPPYKPRSVSAPHSPSREVTFAPHSPEFQLFLSSAGRSRCSSPSQEDTFSRSPEFQLFLPSAGRPMYSSPSPVPHVIASSLPPERPACDPGTQFDLEMSVVETTSSGVHGSCGTSQDCCPF